MIGYHQRNRYYILLNLHWTEGHPCLGTGFVVDLANLIEDHSGAGVKHWPLCVSQIRRAPVG